MQDFRDKKILLGVCGGIAAYKSANLIRELTQAGASVRVVMTESATAFITPMTLQALSGHEVRTALFDPQAERAMGHIELARWADYLVIAPASANTLAKMAHGLADDLLSTLYLVADIPVVVCPAMNRGMWSHPATVANTLKLQERGVIVVGPEEGSQACGDYGFGRLSEVEAIVNTLRVLDVHQMLVGKHVLISAGSTHEAIDPVRFIANHSSGKMGFALALAAKVAGAEVTLVAGPTSIESPAGVNCIRVTSAQEMHQAVMKNLNEGTLYIGAAAVADFSVKQPADKKMKKQDQEKLVLHLERTPDILSAVAASEKAALVVGFAAETHDVRAYATAKLQSKRLDMIVANQVGCGLAFGQDVNQVTVLTKTKQIELPLTHKTRLAGQIIAIMAATLQNATS